MYPDIFTFGDIWFSPFAVMIVFAFIFCFIVGFIDVERRGLRQQGFDYWDLLPAFLLLITGAIGGRLVYALQNWDFFMQNTQYLFFPRYFGVTSFGAIAGGLLTLFLWCFLRKRNLFIMLDLFAFYSGIAYGIIRIGCFLSGCCYGKVTDLPWGVVIQNVDNLPRHPVQLYATLGVVIGVLIILRLRRYSPFHGFITLAIVGYYGILRFTTEFFREGETLWMGLTKAQLAGVGMTVFASVTIYVIYSIMTIKKRKGFLPSGESGTEVTNPPSSPVKEQKQEKKGKAGGGKNKEVNKKGKKIKVRTKRNLILQGKKSIT